MRGEGDARFSGEECSHTIMDCCKRPPIALSPRKWRGLVISHLPLAFSLTGLPFNRVCVTWGGWRAKLTVEYRWAAGQVEQLAALAVELRSSPVEIIVTVGAATAAAQRATPTIPIVFVGVGDPVASGLVRSLAQPGGNITRDSQLERCPHGETAGTPQRDSARALPRGRFVV